MADIITTINEVPVTLTDDLDGTFSIDLSTQQARQFIRAELDQVRADRDLALVERDQHEAKRVQYIAMRDSEIAAKDLVAARIAVLNTRIAELIAFLQNQGDPT